MGGCCCCASKGTELHRSSPFLHYPVLEEHEPLSSHHARISPRSDGLLVDTNLDTSVPDTYRPPPAPIPYETYTGHLPTPSGIQENPGNKTDEVLLASNTNSSNDTYSESTLEVTVKKLEPDDKTKKDIDQEASEELEDEKSNELKKSVENVITQDEEDICPTCFEEYDKENPKIITKCDHHFHLSCILEWMERSDTCPMCDQEMVFSPVGGV